MSHADETDDVEPVISRSSKLEEADMDITPMIDMTFLLLIFFIVTSKVSNDAGVSLPLARHGAVVVTKDAVIITVAPGDPIARVFRGETTNASEQISGVNAEEQEEAVEAYVRDTIGREPNRTSVLVYAEKGLKHREVARIARAAARADEIGSLYVGIMEKK